MRLVEVGGRPGKDAPDPRAAGEHPDVGQRVNAFDLQLAQRHAADAAIGAVGVRLELPPEPVNRRVTRLARAERRPGVLGEIEVAMDRGEGADLSRRESLPRLHEGGEKIAVPDEAPHAMAFERGDQAVAILEPGGQRFVHDDMQTRLRRAHREIAVALGLGTDGDGIEIEPRESRGHVADVRDAELVGEKLVALVRPRGAVRIIGDTDQFETRMRGDGARQVVVFHHTQHAHAERRFLSIGRSHAIASSTSCRARSKSRVVCSGERFSRTAATKSSSIGRRQAWEKSGGVAAGAPPVKNKFRSRWSSA